MSSNFYKRTCKGRRWPNDDHPGYRATREPAAGGSQIVEKPSRFGTQQVKGSAAHIG
jgi:hypothetical protein